MSIRYPDPDWRETGRLERARGTFESSEAMAPITLRDLAGVAFRHGALALKVFTGVLLGAVATAFLLPEQYQARMTILVKRERADAVVSPQPSSTTQVRSTEAAEEEDLNSAAELMKSRDLLEKTAAVCRLDQPSSYFWGLLRVGTGAANNVRLSRAVRRLDKDVKVEIVKKTSLIRVDYASADPVRSARVLSVLGDEYLRKYMAVHRPPGTFAFFEQQAEQYRQRLAAAEAKLSEFEGDADRGANTPQIQRDMTLQKASEFESNLRRSEAAMAMTTERIRSLEGMAAAVPVRLTTADKKVDNAQLLEQLKSTLLNLELKRAEMRDKFESGYRPYQELETQIAETRTAIAREEKAPLREETTDRNPTYQWLDGELARARADLAAYRAESATLSGIVGSYRRDALRLEEKQIVEQALLRTIKAEEASYLLYANKREEARISDALDAERIANVSITEAPVAPTLPVHSRWFLALLGVPFAACVSVGSAFIADHFDVSFRTPGELALALNTPVLAALPDRTD